MIKSKGITQKVEKNINYILEGKKEGKYVFAQPFTSAQSDISEIGDKEVIMLTSNNYLGLATNSEVKEAMKNALDKYGTGTCGARLHNGTTDLHVKLERKCAEFFGAEDAVVFSAGYMANLAGISSIGDKDTLIVTDQFNHESIKDGITLSGAQVRIFSHNNMSKLEHILKNNANFDKKIILVEGIYSMDGDICPLDKVTSLAEKYNASIYVDEAHSFGFVGNNGRGVSELFNVEDKIHMRMTTFSKSLATVGGCIATDRDTAEYIRHFANQYVFNASLPPTLAAGTLKALEIMQTETWRKEKLWKNTVKFRRGLMELGINTMNSVSPVIPIYIGDDEVNMKVTQELLERGVYIATAIYPAVPKGESRLRATITASLSDEDIENSLYIIEKVFKNNKLI